MKLLMCLKCGDIFNLTAKEKTCGCGKVKGQYINDLDAEYSGPAQPLGISNPSFRTAYQLQQFEDTIKKPIYECCKGVEFTAFFIPKDATTITKIDE